MHIMEITARRKRDGTSAMPLHAHMTDPIWRKVGKPNVCRQLVAAGPKPTVRDLEGGD